MLVDSVVGPVRQQGKALGAAVLSDNHRIIRCGGTHKYRLDPALVVDIQGCQRTGTQIGEALHIGVGGLANIHLGVGGDRVLGTTGIRDGSSLRNRNGDIPAGTLIGGYKGDRLAGAVQNDHALASREQPGTRIPRQHIVLNRCTKNGVAGCVFGIAVQKDRVHGRTQFGIEFAAFLLVAVEKIHKQLGGLGAVDSGTSRKADPVTQSDGHGLINIPVGPDRADILVLIAQHPHEDSNRLAVVDGVIRSKGTVRIAGNQLWIAAHRQVHIPCGPVSRLHIRENRVILINIGPISLAHSFHGHLAELCPGQGPHRVEYPAGHAVHHAHHLEHFHILSCGHIRDITEAADCRRFRRHIWYKS